MSGPRNPPKIEVGSAGVRGNRKGGDEHLLSEVSSARRSWVITSGLYGGNVCDESTEKEDLEGG